MLERTGDAFDYNAWFAEEILPLESSLRAYLRACFPRLTSDTDDVVQESFLRVSRTKMAGKLRSPKGLLFRAARNAAIDMFRHGRPLSLDALIETDDLAVVDDGPAVSERVSRHEEVDVLIEAIDALPCRCRQTFELCKLGGLSHKETGMRLGISARTVNVQVGKGVSRCAKYLQARGFNPHAHADQSVEFQPPVKAVRVRRARKATPQGFVSGLAA